jgi:hypothetical protein
MGSVPNAGNVEASGKRASEAFWYTDSDGVLVSFALNLDREIDAWKVDSSALQRPPSAADIRTAPWPPVGPRETPNAY